MAKIAAAILGHVSPRAVGRAIMSAEDAAEFTLDNLSELGAIGLGLTANDVRKMAAGLGMDAAPDLLSGGQANGIYIHFLRNMLPGVVGTMTQARKIDELVGITTAGAWSDEEIVQETMSPAGLAQPYTDKGNIPLASYDMGYETRGVIRFELGFELNKLESDRASRARVNAAQRKRSAVALALNIQRNQVGFYGYNFGNFNVAPVRGFLNDPTLPAYASVAPTGQGGATGWATKDFTAITGDFREAIGDLQRRMAGNFDPRTERFTLALGTGSATYLTVTNLQGSLSVEGWLKQTYPNMRIVDAPELDGANGGQSVFYIYPETVSSEDDGSDDNGRVFDQIVPTLMTQLGVEVGVKGYTEGFTNATAGVLTKRPYAVVRRTGI